MVNHPVETSTDAENHQNIAPKKEYSHHNHPPGVTNLEKKLDSSLKPTAIFHAVLDSNSSSDLPLRERVIALYKQHDYSVLDKESEGVNLRAVNGDGDSHAVIFCDDYVLSHQAIINILDNDARQSFIIMATRRDRALIKLNRDRIARIMLSKKKNDQKVWLIFSGTPSSLERIALDTPPPKDLETFQLILILVAIKKTLVEEGKLSAEKALDDLQDELRIELSMFARD